MSWGSGNAQDSIVTVSGILTSRCALQLPACRVKLRCKSAERLHDVTPTICPARCRYAAGVRTDAEKTERALRQLAGLLDEWAGAQRSWLWLDCIFAGERVMPRSCASSSMREGCCLS